LDLPEPGPSMHSKKMLKQAITEVASWDSKCE
jgi:hypothetical protein